ncbi:MAG TPA: MerR family transcriptional regulator [Ktedonobacteraceae bacterium]|nr:MerR family transcriptional regulator [Ktedonobacteraceae bacterium]
MIQSDVQPQALRIDDLARLTGVPSRTIRFYNTQGLFPPPMMRGRVAYYNQEHLVVLGLIQALKEQNLPLEVIKQLLEIRAHYGEVQMNLALKQRLLPVITGMGQQVRLSRDELAQQANTSAEYIDKLLELELLFPAQGEEELFFSGDDVLLVELYLSLEQRGLPLSLPTLIRFQMRQLVRSEVAALEQHMVPHWQEEQLPLEQQNEQFEQILTLTDTLISVLHRKLVYQV